MKKLLHEPLLSFLLLGALMFGVYEMVAGYRNAGTEQLEEIVITEGHIDTLILGFEKVWLRLPTTQELDRLLDEHIREEVLYREALAMGLDRNDSVIRRRLRQKMDFLSQDIGSMQQATEAELNTFLAANQERFRAQSQFSFEHIYFDVSKRGPSARQDAELLLTSLQERDDVNSGEAQVAGTDSMQRGDRLLMSQSHFSNTAEREIQRILGTQFLDGLKTLPIGSWQGPIESGFGLHLVHLSQRMDGATPVLADVRDAVVREWTIERRAEANEAVYAALRERYIVTLPGLEESANVSTEGKSAAADTKKEG